MSAMKEKLYDLWQRLADDCRVCVLRMKTEWREWVKRNWIDDAPDDFN